MRISEKEKEKILKNLKRVTVKKTEADKIIKTYSAKSLLQGQALKDFRLYQLAIIIAYNELNIEETFKQIGKISGRKTPTVKKYIYPKIQTILSFCDFDAITEERSNIRDNVTSEQKKVTRLNNTVDRLSGVMSFFGIKEQSLKDRMLSISDVGTITKEEHLKELYILRELFMGKAKGEIATTQTEATYEIVEDENGNIKEKKLHKNRLGKSMMSVKTQSYLPDEKALVAIKLLDEMILQIESSNEIEMTEDELEKLYDSYLEDSKKQYELLTESRVING
jgi:hypothetical protein